MAKEGNIKRAGRFLLPAFLLSTVCAITSCPSNQKSIKEEYPLPAEIKVIETSLPYEEREEKLTITDSHGNVTCETRKDKYVKTDDIDFSEDFQLETDRYRFVHDNDWLPSRAIGHVMSIPRKLFFWDWDVSWGADEDRTRAALSMLEKNEDIKDLTVRINHNEAFYDLYRTFTEKKLRDRNNFFARATLGTLTCLFDEMWAELSRGDYYNPITRTTVIYSNVESIAAHEIGHHQDFSRFTSDWEYSLARILPPVMLYQEWKASKNAQNRLLSKEDNWQFWRYLIPAFGTYVFATIGIIAGLFSKDGDE